MRGAHIIVILLVVGLLVFGCTTPNPPAQPNNTGTPPSGGGQVTPPSGGGEGSSGTGAAGGTETGGAGASGTGTSGSTGGSTGGNGGAGNDLANQGYEALVAMGAPLQCDITVNDTTVKVYMKGGTEVRSEVTIDEKGATCRKMVSIIKGDNYYMGCADGTMFPECDWLQMSAQPTGTAGPASSEPPDYTDIPPAKINCVAWVYDASKFATPGTVCSMDDLMKGYQQGNGYPDGYD